MYHSVCSAGNCWKVPKSKNNFLISKNDFPPLHLDNKNNDLLLERIKKEISEKKEYSLKKNYIENTKNIKFWLDKRLTSKSRISKKIINKHIRLFLQKSHDSSIYNKGIHYNDTKKFLFNPFYPVEFSDSILCIIDHYLEWEYEPIEKQLICIKKCEKKIINFKWGDDSEEEDDNFENFIESIQNNLEFHIYILN